MIIDRFSKYAMYLFKILANQELFSKQFLIVMQQLHIKLKQKLNFGNMNA